VSFPTVLAPWYVVQQPAKLDGGTRYYRTDDEGNTIWSENQNDAFLFQSLHSAYRVARATAGEVRVLCDKTDLTEFRPRGEL
jgi:hypothetical protein